MPEKTVAIRCVYCNSDTKITLEVPVAPTATAGKKQKPVTCSHCNRLNVINIPSTWDVSSLTLDDDGFLGYSKGIPVFQGQRS